MNTSARPFYAYSFGKVGLFFHHGHKTKFDSLPVTFMTTCHDVFAETKYWFGHCGHWHHSKKSSIQEFNGFIMEQHSTLTAKDAYAANLGLQSQRKAYSITYHRDYGEYSRVSTTPEMLR